MANEERQCNLKRNKKFMISQIQLENKQHLGHVWYDSMELNGEMEWRRNEIERNKDFIFFGLASFWEWNRVRFLLFGFKQNNKEKESEL